MSKEILIIVPRYVPYRENTYYEFPLGLAYVSACLKQAGYSVDVCNLNHGDGTLEAVLRSSMARRGYGFVLTGGLSAHYRQIKTILDLVKRIDPSVATIVGGGVVTATPKLMFDFLGADYIVVGEGEITGIELLNVLSQERWKDLPAVKGIGFRDRTGMLVLTEPRPPIMNLDSIPWPDLEGFELETYLAMQRPNDNLYLYVADQPRFYPIISSRGCPFNCTFCYHPLGQCYRSRSIDAFMAEIEHVVAKYNVNNLAIFDELLSANRSRLEQICARLKAIPRNLHWMCQLRVDSVNAEILSMLKDAGCFMVSYGFESASDVVLKSMHKHITRKQIERALSLSRAVGIGIQGYFIFGDPAETRETARETLRFWQEHSDYHVTLGCIRPYPGSVLWDRAMPANKSASAEEQRTFLDKCIENPPNLSLMNDQQWFELRREVQRALLLNESFGEYISSCKTSEQGYLIRIRCPHCRQEVQYDNFHQRILGVFKLTCRFCNQAMNMTPLVFDHVRDDYERNRKVFETIKTGTVPVVVTPCMHPGEFQAMADIFLRGINFQCALDTDLHKAGAVYLGMPVLQRTQEVVASLDGKSCFLIPLTRFADRIFVHLTSLGVAPERICRLDEIAVGPITELVKAGYASVEDRNMA